MILKDEFEPNGNHDCMETRLQDPPNNAARIRSCDEKNNKFRYFYQKRRGGEAYDCIQSSGFGRKIYSLVFIKLIELKRYETYKSLEKS